MQPESAFRTRRGGAQGAQKPPSRRGEPGHAAEPTPEVMGEIGPCDARRHGVQLKELADRAGRAECPETDCGPAARPLVRVREEVQAGGGGEPSADRTAMRRLGEPDKAAPVQIWRRVMQPAPVRAKLGREVLACEQMRPKIRLEELPHRVGSQVLLDQRARGLARMGNVEVEDLLGTAREEDSRGIVAKGGRAGAAPAHWRSVS